MNPLPMNVACEVSPRVTSCVLIIEYKDTDNSFPWTGVFFAILHEAMHNPEMAQRDVAYLLLYRPTLSFCCCPDIEQQLLFTIIMQSSPMREDSSTAKFRKKLEVIESSIKEICSSTFVVANTNTTVVKTEARCN
jgi:hypothetical protein